MKNEFDLHEIEPVRETHFQMKEFRMKTRSDREVTQSKTANDSISLGAIFC